MSDVKTFAVNLPEGYERVELPYFDEWVQALESGTYIQGKGSLVSPGTDKIPYWYCCLGVLSKIQGRLIKLPSSCLHYDADNMSNTGVLSLQNPCAGVLACDGGFPAAVTVTFLEREYKNLMDLNDLGMSFKDIATVIKTIWKPVSS